MVVVTRPAAWPRSASSPRVETAATRGSRSLPAGIPGNRHGPGGGGGGGVYFLSTNPAATSSVAGGASGRTTTVLDPYGSAGGAGSTNILGNVTIFDIPGVVPCISVLRGTAGGAARRPRGARRVRHGPPEGDCGLQRLRDQSDEWLGGRLVRLNEEPIASPVPDSMMPIFYRVETAPFDFPFLVIEEIERGGHQPAPRPLPGPGRAATGGVREA